ncbi:MAG: hypothetical protein MUQ10_06910 [Anaerolineae bacterium]|nr:hypothetical protein [Anaerolineae bacterium]
MGRAPELVEDTARHKQAAYYVIARDTVADVMAEDRSSLMYSDVYPNEIGRGIVFQHNGARDELHPHGALRRSGPQRSECLA